MAGIAVTITLAILRISPELRSTSLPPATSAVLSGMSGTTATSGRLSRTMATTRGTRASSWMASPTQRTTATGATAFQFVVYSVSMSVPPVPHFPLQPFLKPRFTPVISLPPPHPHPQNSPQSSIAHAGGRLARFGVSPCLK